MRNSTTLFLVLFVTILLKTVGEVTAQSDLWDVPEGFEVEQVVSDLFLPVNIAFMSNPLPDEDAPIYYITELYGNVKVVLRNGKCEFMLTVF